MATTKILANADIISMVIIFIESNLQAFNTRQEQVDALASFSATAKVRMSKPGWSPYRPTGTDLHTLLRTTVTPKYRRVLKCRNMTNDQVVTQLFMVGRNIFEDDFLDRLSLPSTAAVADSAKLNLRHTAFQERPEEILEIEDVPFEGRQPAAGEKRRRDDAANDGANGSHASKENGQLSKRRAHSKPAAIEPSKPHQQQDDAEVSSRADLVEQTDGGDDDDDDDGDGDESAGDSTSSDSITGHSADIMTVPLEFSLRYIHGAIVKISSLIFPDSTADRLAQLEIVPSPELHRLYHLVLANKSTAWKPVAIDLLSKGILTAQPFLQSLVWAFVQTAILEHSSPLNDLDRLLDSSKEPGKYVEQVLTSQHRVSVDNIRQEVFNAQLNNERFQREVMQPKAEAFANDLMVILGGHFDQLDKTQLSRDWYNDMARGLTTICRDALVLQGRLVGDPERWKLVTLSNGHLVYGPNVKVDSRFPGRFVAFTIMPALRSQDIGTGYRKYRAPALVTAGGEEV